jgi:hypothetical protein
MIKSLGLTVLLAAVLAGCGGGVAQKVKYDFGIGEQPEGYVSTTDKVMENLPEVAAVEIQRLNAEERRGEIQFQEDGEYRGKFYKTAKVYERGVPVDAAAAPRTASERDTRVFYGYIDYVYRIYQGPRRDTRAEAEADRATIATNESGRDSYRYRFGLSGEWNGARGEPVRD